MALDGVSLTVSALREDGFSVSLIPETLKRTNLGEIGEGAHVNIEVDIFAKHVERARDYRRHEHERFPDNHAVRDDRAGDRGHPRGQDGRRLRRRGPRERGRPDAGGAVRDSRGDQLHGQGGPRPDLPVADGRALRRAGAGPDGRQERVAVRNAVHGLRRGARGRDHRHLRARPRPHHPGGHRPGEPAVGPRPARPRVPAQEPRGRRARAGGADRGGGRPRAAGRAEPGGCDLRGDERRRHDGARARTGRLLRTPRAEHDHGRRPDRLPPTSRQTRRTGRRHARCRPRSETSRRSATAR